MDPFPLPIIAASISISPFRKGSQMPVSTILRYLNGALVILIIAALARIGGDRAGVRLKSLFREDPGNRPQKQSPPVTMDLLSFSPILSNGLFGPSTAGTLSPISPSGAATRGVPSPQAAPSDLTLLGTARGSFRETFVLVRKNSTGEERVFRLGDDVFGSGRLLSVGKETMTILSGGKKNVVAMPMSPEAAPSLPAGGGPQPANPLPGAGVTSTGSGSFVIDKRALDAALDNISQAMTDARLLPSTKDGKIEGFRASEVKPQGVFGMVGIRNGDVIARINDFPIDSPDKAMQAFMTLKGQNRIKLDLIREGRPTTFTYDIR